VASESHRFQAAVAVSAIQASKERMLDAKSPSMDRWIDLSLTIDFINTLYCFRSGASGGMTSGVFDAFFARVGRK